MADDLSSRKILPCLRLSKATLTYCPIEDRIRLDGLSTGSDTIRLWFTERLLVRLIQHVIALAGSTQQGSKSSVKEQAAALAEESARPQSVVIHSGSPEVLISAIDVKVGKNRLEFTYKNELGAQLAMLTLPHSKLPQWNHSLRLCFEHADWSLSVFDRALDSEVLNRESSRVTLH